jgi:hypothetical protein
MFAADDIDAVLARLRTQGAELVGEVVQFDDSYRLCYVRGPEGIMVALAEPLGGRSCSAWDRTRHRLAGHRWRRGRCRPLGPQRTRVGRIWTQYYLAHAQRPRA